MRINMESVLFCRPVAGACDGMNSVTEKDLEHLLLLFDRKDGEMEWQNIMERSTCNLTYQAWYHEPEVGLVSCFAVSILQFWRKFSWRKWHYSI